MAESQETLSSAQVTYYISELSSQKTQKSPLKVFMLAVLAGAFVGLAAQASNMAIHTITNYSVNRIIGGVVFTVGLMFVLLSGAELFTGNSLMVGSVLDKKITLQKMLFNWLIVYLGNFTGAILVAFLINRSGLLDSSNGLLGGITIKIAANKVNLTFERAFILGILCNWVVCLAIRMSYSTHQLAGKVLAVFFPIWLFALSGFEHSVANMYYIPAGILAKNNESWLKAADLTASALNKLNWQSFIVNNLIPVTLGNIVGGTLLVGVIYWYIYNEKQKDAVSQDNIKYDINA